MDQPAKPLKWHQGLHRYCWVVLIISALGWLFDTMDQNLFTLVRKPSMEDLILPREKRAALSPQEKAAFEREVSDKGTTVTMVFIYGWAAGGFIFGILGDRLGRTRTMMLTILIYAVCTGASGLAHHWIFYAAARFLTGLGVGGEWAAGAALVAETFPQRSRPMALGLLQALSSVGNMLASVITLSVTSLLPMVTSSSNFDWRIVYFLGAAPALLVLWIRRSVREPEQWVHAKERATMGKEMGKIGELFTHPELRRRILAAVLLCTAGVAALWGVGFFSTDFVATELEHGGMNEQRRKQISQIMFFLQNLGSFFGIYTFAVLSEKLNRRKAFVISYVAAWLSILLFFWAIADTGKGASVRALCLAPVLGFCTLMPFSGFTLYFPELFPTRLRATGCGFAYNASRFFAASAPKALSALAGAFATYEGSVRVKTGTAPAASIVAFVYLLGFLGVWLGPETKGLPLPEDKDFTSTPVLGTTPATQQT